MNAPSPNPIPPYRHTPLFPLGKDSTPYRRLPVEGVRVEQVLGEEVLVVPAAAIKALSEEAFNDINHYLRPGHLAQLASILKDAEASDNDKFVAYDFLKNANIAAGGTLRIQAAAPFRSRWSGDDWQRVENIDSTSIGTGHGFVDVRIPLRQRAPTRFTFFWTSAGRWEGRDFHVAIQREKPIHNTP